ncbi:MAG: dihydropteroate synthase [Actinomycetota bacterium]|nr:dihydropteroate synthase [Actinomycetota bacterium]
MDPPVRLRLPTTTLEIPAGRPVLMGIVNANDDSFSDGGRFSTLDAQVAHALQLVADGAGIIDVGGESGVTDTAPRAPEEEAALVVPLVARLVAEGVVVSVDTWKPPVAEAVLAEGASIINDVSGLRDPELAAACARHGGALVVMHTRVEPKHKVFPDYADGVTADVESFLAERLDVARAAGVGDDQLIFDPGPDFAKTPAESIELLRALPRLLGRFGLPVLLAVSRKDFVGALTSTAPRDRGPGTLAAVGEGVDAGAHILRVHEVAATAQYLTVRAALRGELEVPADLSVPEHLRRQRVGPVTRTGES